MKWPGQLRQRGPQLLPPELTLSRTLSRKAAPQSTESPHSKLLLRIRAPDPASAAKLTTAQTFSLVLILGEAFGEDRSGFWR